MPELYTDRMLELNSKIHMQLERVNLFLTKLYIEKYQLSQIRKMDNEVANTHEDADILTGYRAPQNLINKFKQHRTKIRKPQIRIGLYYEQIDKLPDKAIRFDTELSDSNPHKDVIQSIEEKVRDIDDSFQTAKSEFESELEEITGFSAEESLVEDMFYESKAAELFDDKETQREVIGCLQDHTSNDPISEVYFREHTDLYEEDTDTSVDSWPVDIDDVNDLEELETMVPVYPLKSITLKADVLYESRVDSAAKARRQAESLKRLLSHITDDSISGEFTDTISELETLIGTLSVKVDSPKELSDDRELVNRIEDMVYTVKDTAFHKLSD